MENKINIAELLKDCPKGMELNCTMFNNVTFEGIIDRDSYNICIKVPTTGKYYLTYYLTEYGCWNTMDNAKCVIFPKGKTTWEGFEPSCNKANGYKWNAETKSLEKLNKFTVGDIITNGKIIRTICSIDVDSYKLEDGSYVFFNEVHKWELIPNKFDINTLIPFESRVLTRDDGYSIWQPNVWGLYDKEHRFPYVTTGNRYRYCIPYEGNEHLLNKTDDCYEYYKTWE